MNDPHDGREFVIDDMGEEDLERAVMFLADMLFEPVILENTAKDCGNDCDCNDCEEASECQEKWEYGFDCDADCRNCNNDDCRDR